MQNLELSRDKAVSNFKQPPNYPYAPTIEVYLNRHLECLLLAF